MDTTNHCPNCEDMNAKAATPHSELMAQLADSRLAKTEREHAAWREIESLRKAVAVKDQALRIGLGWATGGMDGDWKECDHIQVMRAALSSTPPSGMVVVAVSKEDAALIVRRMTEGGWKCAVCEGYGNPEEGIAVRHKPGCWLSALIGGDDANS